jgi:hypothetical protein
MDRAVVSEAANSSSNLLGSKFSKLLVVNGSGVISVRF